MVKYYCSCISEILCQYREILEYFLEQLRWPGKSTPFTGKYQSISQNSYAGQAKVLHYQQNYCSASALARQFHLEFTQQQDSFFGSITMVVLLVAIN